MPNNTCTITIMIVDDAPFMRTILRSVLEMAGYTVVAEAADGAEAVVRYRELRPTLTLMDIVMPVRNGAEAAAAITSYDAGAKVVFCGLPGQRGLIAMCGRDVIKKPYEPDEVLAVVQRAVQS